MLMAHEHPRPEPDDWRRGAACLTTDPALFFDDRVRGQALAVCAGCPVRHDCLEDALSLPRNEDQGIRGGMTQRERQRLHTARNPRRPAECGTVSGYDSHRRKHTAMCEPCREARAVYSRALRLRQS